MSKVSIIIPIFNVEEYLPKCLDSVVNQTLKDIEIICIDDCSTDNSYQILQEYASKDERFIVLKQETNQGQGVARNRALNIAKGEFVGFVDSDNYIESNYFEKLYSIACKYNADIATTNILKHKKFYKRYNVLYKKYVFKSDIKDKILLCNDKKIFFFFTHEGKPIIRLKHQVSKKHINTSMFTRSILHMQALIYNKFKKYYPYAPHHNVDAYTKSKYLECIKCYKNEFEKTMKHKFRTEGDIQRVAITYYLLAKNYGKLKLYSRIDRYLSIIARIKKRIKKHFSADSIVINMNNKNPYRMIKKYKPKLFCVNDGEGISDYDRKRIKIFLEEKFPDKSKFEL